MKLGWGGGEGEEGEEGRVNPKKSLVGMVWIFHGTMQCSEINVHIEIEVYSS